MPHTTLLGLVAASGLATSLLLVAPAFAQTQTDQSQADQSQAEQPAAAAPAPADPTEVLATVGEREITRADLDAYKTRIADRLGNVPPERRDAQALDVLIDQILFARLAQDAGLDQSEEFKRNMALTRDQVLQSGYVGQLANTITDEEVKRRYDEEIAKVTAPQEVRARHILVKTEDEAKAVIEEVKGGADFAEVAKAKSTGPSGPRGGDLGFFGRGQMVPEFDQAAFAMEPGDVSEEPVKTQFGYHVIKVEEKREQPLPTLEQSSERMRQFILRDRYLEEVKKARDTIGVTISDESLRVPQD